MSINTFLITQLEYSNSDLKNLSCGFTLQATSISLQRWIHDGRQWKTWHLNELSAQCVIIPQKVGSSPTPRNDKYRIRQSSNCSFDSYEKSIYDKFFSKYFTLSEVIVNDAGEILTITGSHLSCGTVFDTFSIAVRRISIPAGFST